MQQKRVLTCGRSARQAGAAHDTGVLASQAVHTLAAPRLREGMSSAMVQQDDAMIVLTYMLQPMFDADEDYDDM